MSDRSIIRVFFKYKVASSIFFLHVYENKINYNSSGDVVGGSTLSTLFRNCWGLPYAARGYQHIKGRSLRQFWLD